MVIVQHSGQLGWTGAAAERHQELSHQDLEALLHGDAVILTLEEAPFNLL